MNDVTGGRREGVRQIGDKGGRGIKNMIVEVTSFLNGPVDILVIPTSMKDLAVRSHLTLFK